MWALYDDDEGFPRFYAHIQKVQSNPRSASFRCRITWLECMSPWAPPPTPIGMLGANTSSSTTTTFSRSSSSPSKLPHSVPVGYFKARGSCKWESSINVFAFPLPVASLPAVPTAKQPFKFTPSEGQVWTVHLSECAAKGEWEKYGLVMIGRVEHEGRHGGGEGALKLPDLRPSEKIRGNYPVSWLKLIQGYSNVYEVSFFKRSHSSAALSCCLLLEKFSERCFIALYDLIPFSLCFNSFCDR